MTLSKHEFTQEGLEGITRGHWQKHCPKYWAMLVKEGLAQERVQHAAEVTLITMKGMVQRGYTLSEAWEIMREEYILLKEEMTPEEKEAEEAAAWSIGYQVQVELQQEKDRGGGQSGRGVGRAAAVDGG